MSDPHPAPAPEPAEGDGEGIEHKARSAKVWVLLGYGGSQVIRFTGNLILTRLLLEEAFGVMALMEPVLIGILLFSDIGIGPSLIQSKRVDERFVNTAWTMQVLRGGGVFLAACAAAIPFSMAYPNYPEVAYLLPVVAGTALIEGFGTTAFFTLNRNLDVRRIEAVEVSSQTVGFIVKVSWALAAPSVLALVAGTLCVKLTRLIMGHLYLPGTRARFRWDKKAAGELIRFGKWIFVSTVLTFLSSQIDRLVFGSIVTRDQLGVYGVAAMIAALPSAALGRLSFQVIFPVYSRLQQLHGDFRDAFRSTRRSVLMIGGWGFAGLIAGGPTGVQLIYDDRWIAAGWIIQILASGSWFMLMESTYGAALLARGTPKWNTLGSAAKIAGMAILIPTGYHLGEAHLESGFQGAVAGYAAAEVFRYTAATVVAQVLGYRGLGQDAALSAWVAITGLSGLALAMWLDALGLHVGLRAAAIALAVSAAWLPLAMPEIRRRLAERRAKRSE